MTEQDEETWDRGYKAALRRVLGDVLRGLDQEGDAKRWWLERMDTVAALRRVCGEYGDNDWEDRLHLSDVVEKHLERYLEWRAVRSITKVSVSGTDQHGEPVEEQLSIGRRDIDTIVHQIETGQGAELDDIAERLGVPPRFGASPHHDMEPDTCLRRRILDRI